MSCTCKKKKAELHSHNIKMRCTEAFPLEGCSMASVDKMETSGLIRNSICYAILSASLAVTTTSLP